MILGTGGMGDHSAILIKAASSRALLRIYDQLRALSRLPRIEAYVERQSVLAGGCHDRQRVYLYHNITK